jgi:hypothetical protein
MEKIFEKPILCAECNEELDQFFLFCRSCNTYICYYCFSNHRIDHNYLPCITLENNKAKVLDVGLAGYGPPMEDIWPSLGIDSFISSHHAKCSHAVDYFEKNNITFFCHECRKWYCLDCIDNHSNHGLMLHVGFNNGTELRQIDPNLYKSEHQLVLSCQAFETDEENIKVELEIKNYNSLPIYDLQIMYTFYGLDDDIWDGNNLEMMDNETFLCNNITELEIYPPNESNKASYELSVSNRPDLNLSSITTIIRYKDVFLGKGIVLKKSIIEKND